MALSGLKAVVVIALLLMLQFCVRIKRYVFCDLGGTMIFCITIGEGTANRYYFVGMLPAFEQSFQKRRSVVHRQLQLQ